MLAAAAIALLAITDSAAAHLEDAIDATASSRVISTATPAGQLPAPSSNVELVGKARVADEGRGWSQTLRRCGTTRI